MKSIKTIAAASAVAAAFGLAAVGVGSGVAGAAPPMPGNQFAEWDHGHYGGHGPWGGRGWGGPPPPPYYGYGGYDQPCLTGPLGFLRLCP